MDLENSQNWTEQDLLDLAHNQVEESAGLDYKRREALLKADAKKDISKDVSAFANSAGGIIVYGMIEDQHVPRELDEGFSPATTTKEWLEQVIQGNVRPRIQGIHINPIPLKSTHPGNVCYVVTIPQGITAHQASDLRYYRRFNFESVPMEDHEIRDVMARHRYPLIEPGFSYENLKKGDVHEYKLLVSLRNVGATRARDIKLVLNWSKGVPMELGNGFSIRNLQDSTELTVQRTDVVIFPMDEWRVTDDSRYRFTYKVDNAVWDFIMKNKPLLIWKIYADDMPPQSGQCEISDIQNF